MFQSPFATGEDSTNHLDSFLTQTRPMKTPLRSQLFTPTQAAKISQRPMQDVFSPRSAVRQPLATIAALMTNNDDDDDVDAHPLMRLKRRKISPEKSVASGSRGGSASPTPHKPKNAFEMMRQASMHPQKLPALLGGKTKRSEFIEGEAEESDDDEMRGFGLRKRVEDEDEDDEAQDQTLQELVDDQDMDENTLAEDAVLEKHRSVWGARLAFVVLTCSCIGSSSSRMTKRSRSCTRTLSRVNCGWLVVTGASGLKTMIPTRKTTTLLELGGGCSARSATSRATPLTR